MTDVPTDGPSEEELRAYLESMRAAQPVEIVVQSFGILATAAEVKLGLGDARVLIDGMAALVDATAPQIPSEILRRMRETVSQLQMAQVQAEREAGQPAGAGDASGAAGSQPAAQQPSAQQPSGAQEPEAESVTSRLWIPGRD